MLERFTVCRLIYHRLCVKWGPSSFDSPTRTHIISTSHRIWMWFYFPPFSFHHVYDNKRFSPAWKSDPSSSSSHSCTDGGRLNQLSGSQIWLSETDRHGCNISLGPDFPPLHSEDLTQICVSWLSGFRILPELVWCDLQSVSRIDFRWGLLSVWEEWPFQFVHGWNFWTFLLLQMGKSADAQQQ